MNAMLCKSTPDPILSASASSAWCENGPKIAEIRRTGLLVDGSSSRPETRNLEQEIVRL